MNTALICRRDRPKDELRSKPKQFLELHGKPIILYTPGTFLRTPGDR